MFAINRNVDQNKNWYDMRTNYALMKEILVCFFSKFSCVFEIFCLFGPMDSDENSIIKDVFFFNKSNISIVIFKVGVNKIT